MRTLFDIFRRNFVAGILILAPAAVTIWLIRTLWVWINAPLYEYFSAREWPHIWGLGLFVLLGGIFLAGFVARTLIGRWFIGLGESIVRRLPVVGAVYAALKQILETVLSDHSEAFRQAVLLEYPRRGVWTIAFLTGTVAPGFAEHMRPAGSADSPEEDPGEMAYCFVPTTPNPTSGYLIMIPRRELIPLDINVDEALKLVISGGMVSPYRAGGREVAMPADATRPIQAGDTERGAP